MANRASSLLLSAKPNPDDVLDVDFEPVVTAEKSKNNDNNSKTRIPSGFQKPTTLLDVSLDSGDPKWKETRIPFTLDNGEYIDGKLAFTVEMEGQLYGIAVPFDDAVAIVVETAKDGDNNNDKKKKKKKKQRGEKKSWRQTFNDMNIEYVNPDEYEKNDDWQALMEIMAAQVQEQLGEDYVLRKTPKVLTISGGLSKVTDDWERNLNPEPTPVDEFLETFLKDDEQDEETMLNEFYSFMRDELGDEEFEKTMNEEMSEEDKEMAKYFEMPQGFMDSTEHGEMDMDEILKSMKEDLDMGAVEEEAKTFEMDTSGMALKLIGFKYGDGQKAYSLVKLLEPYVLVGKYVPGSIMGRDEDGVVIDRIGDDKGDGNDDDETDTDRDMGMHFELLTVDEEKVIKPKLEELCQKDLKEKGLTLQNPESALEP